MKKIETDPSSDISNNDVLTNLSEAMDSKFKLYSKTRQKNASPTIIDEKGNKNVTIQIENRSGGAKKNPPNDIIEQPSTKDISVQRKQHRPRRFTLAPLKLNLSIISEENLDNLTLKISKESIFSYSVEINKKEEPVWLLGLGVE